MLSLSKFNWRKLFIYSIYLFTLGDVSEIYAEDSEEHLRGYVPYLHRTAPSCPIPRKIVDSATPPTLLFDFMGKAERAPFDIGVIKAMFAASPTLRANKAIYGGNSSGALLAAYFACWGVSQESIKELEDFLGNYDFEELNVNTAIKQKRIVANKIFGAKVKLEEDHEKIGALIDRILNHKGSPPKVCQPKRGIIISATNLDILDTRAYHEGQAPKVPIWLSEQPNEPEYYALPRLFDKNNDRTVNWENFNVTKDSKIIGKACTYFVTQDMFDLLNKLGPEKRQCDLRLIQDVKDLRLAVLASVAEPTFFDPVPEPDKTKLTGMVQPGTRRVYVGGYLVSPLGKDLKQVDPGAFVIGTGVEPFPNSIDKILSNWYAMSPNESLRIQKESLDAEVDTGWDWKDEIPVASELIQMGFERAKALLAPFQAECKLP